MTGLFPARAAAASEVSSAPPTPPVVLGGRSVGLGVPPHPTIHADSHERHHGERRRLPVHRSGHHVADLAPKHRPMAAESELVSGSSTPAARLQMLTASGLDYRRGRGPRQ